MIRPMTSTVLYSGNLRTEATHLKSGNTLLTDAPTDNHGLGETFSPTDLVATALASCMLTVMGIKANALGKPMDGATAEVTKVMQSGPRRIQRVEVTLRIPTGTLTEDERQTLERVGRGCPVARSLSEQTEQRITFAWT